MDLHDILVFFQGSIFPDELRGDLSQVRGAIEELNKASASTDSPESRARNALLNAIFAMMKGNLTQSWKYFEELHQIRDLPNRWPVRISRYEALWHDMRRYPAAIRFFQEMGGFSVAFYSEDFLTVDHTTSCLEVGKQFIDHLSPLDQLEILTIGFALARPVHLWVTAFMQHPRYAKGPWSAQSKAAPAAFAQRMNTLQTLKRLSTDVDVPPIYRFLRYLEVEMYLGAGSPKGVEILDEIRLQAVTTNDIHSLASCKMLEADNLVSTPLSSPIALNLISQENHQCGYSNHPRDLLETSLRFCDSQRPRMLYSEALDLFQQEKIRQGCAAILLRQGCTEHMAVLAIANKGPAEGAMKHLALAKEKLERARDLFTPDEVHENISKGHLILVKISLGETDDIIRQAANIGKWGKEAQNELVSRFVGAVMMRLGRRQMLDHNRNEFGHKCFRCARALFQSLENVCGTFHALEYEISALMELHDHVMARTTVEHANKVLRRLIVSLDGRALDAPSKSDRSRISAMKESTIYNYAILVTRVLSACGDLKELDEWRSEFRPPTTLNHLATFKSQLINAAPYLGLGERRKNLTGQEILNEVGAVQAVSSRFSDCQTKYNQALDSMDLPRAEEHFARFLDQVDFSIPEAASFGIMAASMIRDKNRARTILESIIDEDYIYDVVPMDDASQFSNHPSRNLEKPLNMAGTENLLAMCVIAEDWGRGCRVVNKIAEVSPSFFVTEMVQDSMQYWCRHAAAGIILEMSGRAHEAFSYLIQAAELSERYRDQINNPHLRQSVGNSIVASVYPALARLCLCAADNNVPLAVINRYPHGHPHASSWQEHALLFMEQGKARYLLDTLGSQEGAPDAAIEEEVHGQRRKMLTLQAFPTKGAQELSELAALKAQLQGIEGFESSVIVQTQPLGETPPEAFFKAIQPGSLLVNGDLTSHGFILFGITCQGIQFAQQRRMNEAQLRAPAMYVMKHLQEYSSRLGEEPRSSEGDAAFHTALQAIAEEILDPLTPLLDSNTHIIFALTGRWATFPYSTLPFKEKPLVLRKAISYAPSLATLSYLSKRPLATTPRVTAIAKRVSSASILEKMGRGSTWTDKISALGRGLSEMVGVRDESERPLFMAGVEAIAISQMFGASPMDGAELDQQKTMEAFSNSDIMHIGCHGNFYPSSPLLSYISLKERLRVFDILPKACPTPLVCFSACLSGMGKATEANDVLGFSSAVLERGCTAFLGSLWKVNDISTMILMTTFYRSLRDNSGSLSTAELFRRAQASLYLMNAQQRMEAVTRLLQDLPPAELAVENPKPFVKGARRNLTRAAEAVGNFDFSHPFFYAPFILVGYGDLTFPPFRGV